MPRGSRRRNGPHLRAHRVRTGRFSLLRAALPPEAIEIPEPLIVVEVLSEGTAARDHGLKLAGYFSLPSLAHYLILDPDARTAIHHKRGQGEVIETGIFKDGVLRLEPPGLEIPVRDLFAPA
jgi:Uma2 family endonuclease